MFNIRDFKSRHVGAQQSSAPTRQRPVAPSSQPKDSVDTERESEALFGPDEPSDLGRPILQQQTMSENGKTSRKDETKKPTVRRSLRHLARCTNCGNETCRNAALKADWVCIHWHAAKGVTVKWSDYEEVR